MRPTITQKRLWHRVRNAGQFDGELDPDGLSTNRISSNAGNLIEFTAQTPIQPNTNFLILCYFDKTGSEIGVRVNGSNAFTPETDYDNSLRTTAGMNIFRNRGSQSFGGKMFEFMVAQTQPGTGGGDKTYIEQAEGYLAHKWGMTSLLPVSHPYKSVAPNRINIETRGKNGKQNTTSSRYPQRQQDKRTVRS